MPSPPSHPDTDGTGAPPASRPSSRPSSGPSAGRSRLRTAAIVILGVFCLYAAAALAAGSVLIGRRDA